MSMIRNDRAIVIGVGKRYFIGFGKKGRLQTGCSLSSAKLFADWQIEKIQAVETKLIKKGYKPIRMTVTCEPEPEPEPVRAVCYSAQDVMSEVGLSDGSKVAVPYIDMMLDYPEIPF
jgi:hypothetical protein